MMSDKIKKMRDIVQQYQYLEGEYKSLWPLVHDDGKCTFERVMAWLAIEDNRYQMEMMIKLAKDVEDVTND